MFAESIMLFDQSNIFWSVYSRWIKYLQIISSDPPKSQHPTLGCIRITDLCLMGEKRRLKWKSYLHSLVSTFPIIVVSIINFSTNPWSIAGPIRVHSLSVMAAVFDYCETNCSNSYVPTTLKLQKTKKWVCVPYSVYYFCLLEQRYRTEVLLEIVNVIYSCDLQHLIWLSVLVKHF